MHSYVLASINLQLLVIWNLLAEQIFMHSWVEHEKKFNNTGAWSDYSDVQADWSGSSLGITKTSLFRYTEKLYHQKI